MSRRKKRITRKLIVFAFEILILITLLFLIRKSNDYLSISSTGISIKGIDDLSSTVNNAYILASRNYLISAEITYTLPHNEIYVLDSNSLSSWLIQDENGNYLKDEDIWNKHIEDFVKNKLSPMVNQIDNPKEFQPTGKDYTVFVKNENYGYLIDTDAEIQQLKEDLKNKNKITRDPCYQTAQISDENYGFGNSYIEIDLTRQKVWFYLNGNLELETDCVTGCLNKGHETPTGIFTLTYKETDRILKGQILPNGKREYESHVDYWMPFNGGIGLHDATWRDSFGGDIYINNGSHGCINLPLDAAKKLYNLINSDIPIIVYKS